MKMYNLVFWGGIWKMGVERWSELLVTVLCTPSRLRISALLGTFSVLNRNCRSASLSYLEMGRFVIGFGCWLAKPKALESKAQLYTWRCPLHSVSTWKTQTHRLKWDAYEIKMPKWTCNVLHLILFWYLTLVLTEIRLFSCLYSECKSSCLHFRLNLILPAVLELNAVLKPPAYGLDTVCVWS